MLVSLPAPPVTLTSSSGLMTQSSLGWKKNGAEIRCLDAELFTRCIVARNCPSVQASTTSPMLTTNVPAARRRIRIKWDSLQALLAGAKKISDLKHCDPCQMTSVELIRGTLTQPHEYSSWPAVILWFFSHGDPHYFSFDKELAALFDSLRYLLSAETACDRSVRRCLLV